MLVGDGEGRGEAEDGFRDDPHQTFTLEPRDQIFKEQAKCRFQTGDAKAPQANRLCVRPKDLDAYGYSDRCVKWEHTGRYGNVRSKPPHNAGQKA